MYTIYFQYFPSFFSYYFHLFSNFGRVVAEALEHSLKEELSMAKAPRFPDDKSPHSSHFTAGIPHFLALTIGCLPSFNSDLWTSHDET